MSSAKVWQEDFGQIVIMALSPCSTEGVALVGATAGVEAGRGRGGGGQRSQTASSTPASSRQQACHAYCLNDSQRTAPLAAICCQLLYTWRNKLDGGGGGLEVAEGRGDDESPAATLRASCFTREKKNGQWLLKVAAFPLRFSFPYSACPAPWR